MKPLILGPIVTTYSRCVPMARTIHHVTQCTGLPGIEPNLSAIAKLARTPNRQQVTCTPNVPLFKLPLNNGFANAAYPAIGSTSNAHAHTIASTAAHITNGCLHQPSGTPFATHTRKSLKWRTSAPACQYRALNQSGSVAAHLCHRPAMTDASITSAKTHVPMHRTRRRRLPRTCNLSSSF